MTQVQDNKSVSGGIRAQAGLHHQYLLGLQLMVATREAAEVTGEWMFHLFRQQHEEKFLSGFKKLDLEGLPDAVACAQYHVLSNGMGGVTVEYMEESDRKAWVRFRYPRWMYDGAVICGAPPETSRGFLRGWYAQNGPSLGNPRLGFVCVSEDMTGQFGLCGYFREYDHVLDGSERLQFKPDERPPPYDEAKQPRPPEAGWPPERLSKANRNYAMDYIRNGLSALITVLGPERTRELASLAARLTGLQYYAFMAEAVGGVDGGADDAARFLIAMFAGMGDEAELASGADAGSAVIHHSGLRIVRGLEGEVCDILLACWIELWRGAVASHRTFMEVDVEQIKNQLIWRINALPEK
ncbi:MAG: hypothetical protein V6Z81_03845 [Parvularculales bacterium]